jgi:3-hydroxyisobutyrate dehydrogenase
VSARVGFVGLGNMGRPMAHNLVAAGFALTVRDADEDRQERFAAEHGCAAAAAAAELADVEIVVTMLPDDRVVREVILDWDGGIALALAPGSVVLDMSSSNPDGTLALGRELATRGIALVDAPVSGGVPRAESATLAIMIGGDDEDAVSRAQPVLAALGDRHFRTGPLGSGHAMKALNNYVGGTAYVAVAEALAIGGRYGLQPSTMVDVLNASTGRSFNSEVVFKEHVLTGRYGTGFALGLLAKDVGIAAALDESNGVEAPVCRLVSDRWAAAASELGFPADHSCAHRSWWPADFLDERTRAAGG